MSAYLSQLRPKANNMKKRRWHDRKSLAMWFLGSFLAFGLASFVRTSFEGLGSALALLWAVGSFIFVLSKTHTNAIEDRAFEHLVCALEDLTTYQEGKVEDDLNHSINEIRKAGSILGTFRVSGSLLGLRLVSLYSQIGEGLTKRVTFELEQKRDVIVAHQVSALVGHLASLLTDPNYDKLEALARNLAEFPERPTTVSRRTAIHQTMIGQLLVAVIASCVAPPLAFWFFAVILGLSPLDFMKQYAQFVATGGIAVFAAVLTWLRR